jgi:hypothetical protein
MEALRSKELILDRINHVINHSLILRDKIVAEDFEGMKADNDASAIAWGGVFLICAIASILQEEKFLS